MIRIGRKVIENLPKRRPADGEQAQDCDGQSKMLRAIFGIKTQISNLD